jgi:hypothetical protein
MKACKSNRTLDFRDIHHLLFNSKFKDVSHVQLARFIHVEQEKQRKCNFIPSALIEKKNHAYTGTYSLIYELVYFSLYHCSINISHMIWNATCLECLNYTSENHKIVTAEVFTTSRHQKA